jgi:hypothetical protein
MTVSKGSKNHSEGSAPFSPAGRPFLWLNVLCLDAPLVALSWQLLFARTFGIRVRATECAALFLTAWGIYLVDRFADSIVLNPAADRSVRADFCLRHRRPHAALLVIVALADGAVILAGLTREMILPGLIIGAIALFYLVINYFFSAVWRMIPVKEVAIGFLFAAGVVLVLRSRAAHFSFDLLLTAILFGGVCALNCMSIAVWERDLDREQGKHSFATDRAGARVFVLILAGAIAISCCVESLVSPVSRPLTVCLEISTLSLMVLHFVPVARDERVALADLVLLTPVAFFLVETIL